LIFCYYLHHKKFHSASVVGVVLIEYQHSSKPWTLAAIGTLSSQEGFIYNQNKIMSLIIFGVTQTPIGVDEFLISCPSCETHSWADIIVMSHYFHIYMLPFFPTNKDANVICKTCGLKRYGISFDQRLVSNYDEIKKEYRHPWFTYSGFAIIIFIIVSIILVATFK